CIRKNYEEDGQGIFSLKRVGDGGRPTEGTLGESLRSCSREPVAGLPPLTGQKWLYAVIRVVPR
ncbi:MAG: hypothetical protein ACFNO6_05000, partial [Anaeroglobus sp.]